MADDLKEAMEIEELTIDEAELLEEILDEFGGSRRRFLGQSTSVALSALVLEFLAKRNALAGTVEDLLAPPAADENAVTVAFRVNGSEQSVTLQSRITTTDA